MDPQAYVDQVKPLSKRNGAPFVAAIPGSKSYTNRALMLAALRPGRTTIRGALHCDDTRYLSQCLDGFDGLSVVTTDDGFEVERREGKLGAPAGELFAGAAGAPARFLLSFAAATEGSSVVTGNERLRERPMGDLIDALGRLGIQAESQATPGCLPVRVTGGDIASRSWSIHSGVSSQFVSSLILLAAQQQEPVEVVATGHLVSKPYVQMTLRMLADNGIRSEIQGDRFTIHPAIPQNDVIPVEVDASAMSYFLVAAAITGTTVRIEGIDSGSAQGDVGLARALERMGCTLAEEKGSLTLTGGPLHGIDIDMEAMPDVVLSLAIAAGVAKGETRISNIANLRVKECDRIHAAATELARVGIDAEQGEDFLVIRPGARLRPARVETYDDHRVAMSFGLYRLLADGIEIEEPACVAKSFPAFWQELARFVAHHQEQGTS
jgi:3-phosphoshikimate 1-carboxyvinyltransferase